MGRSHFRIDFRLQFKALLYTALVNVWKEAVRLALNSLYFLYYFQRLSLIFQTRIYLLSTSKLNVISFYLMMLLLLESLDTKQELQLHKSWSHLYIFKAKQNISNTSTCGQDHPKTIAVLSRTALMNYENE